MMALLEVTKVLIPPGEVAEEKEAGAGLVGAGGESLAPLLLPCVCAWITIMAIAKEMPRATSVSSENWCCSMLVTRNLPMELSVESPTPSLTAQSDSVTFLPILCLASL